jgi:hypothetical protein
VVWPACAASRQPSEPFQFVRRNVPASLSLPVIENPQAHYFPSMAQAKNKSTSIRSRCVGPYSVVASSVQDKFQFQKVREQVSASSHAPQKSFNSIFVRCRLENKMLGDGQGFAGINVEPSSTTDLED